jgi:hypothetical protein
MAALGWMALGALIGALITWAVSFFVPGVYRHWRWLQRSIRGR